MTQVLYNTENNRDEVVATIMVCEHCGADDFTLVGSSIIGKEQLRLIRTTEYRCNSCGKPMTLIKRNHNIPLPPPDWL